MAESARRLAKHIPVVQHVGPTGQVFSLLIDGEEFPWHITEGGVHTTVGREDLLPTITVTIPAEQLSIDHAWLTSSD